MPGSGSARRHLPEILPGSGQSQGGPAGIHHPRLIYHSADPPQLLVMEPLRGKAGAGGSFIKQENLTNQLELCGD